MPSDEYSSVVSSALKLKGQGVKKKKKKPKTSSSDSSRDQAVTKEIVRSEEQERAVKKKEEEAEEKEPEFRDDRARKTAVELRHEERRQRVLDERLRKEGYKTHKQRVEDLNRYLAGLSEHHDMPRIGPG